MVLLCAWGVPKNPQAGDFMTSVKPKVTSLLENHSSVIRAPSYLFSHAQEGLESTSVRGTLGKVRPLFLPLCAYCLSGEGVLRSRLRSNREDKHVPGIYTESKEGLSLLPLWVPGQHCTSHDSKCNGPFDRTGVLCLIWAMAHKSVK